MSQAGLSQVSNLHSSAREVTGDIPDGVEHVRRVHHQRRRDRHLHPSLAEEDENDDEESADFELKYGAGHVIKLVSKCLPS